MSGQSNISYASQTDVGVRRSHNQDAYAVLPAGDAEQFQQRGHVFLVADGMGAHAVGELASKLAADSIPHIYSKYAQEGPRAALRKAFVEANLTIHSRGQQNPEFEGMGTTGTALLLRPEGAWVAHVGDSRAYRVRAGRIEQLTFDHSLLWELARRKNLNPDDVHNVPSNVIIRSLGPEPLVQVDLEGPHPLQPGDAFVLCSDGLSGQLTDPEIGAVVRALPPEEACRLLVDLANLHGGPDNITVIIAHVQGPTAAPAGPRSRRPPFWPEWLPWPLACLLLGILLAVVAIALSSYHLPYRVPVFLLAAGALLGGLAGLFLQHREDQQRQVQEAERPALKVYRSAACIPDAGMVEKLAKAAAALEGRLREHHLEADWAAAGQYQERGREHLGLDEPEPAFREYCRAVRLLAAALQRHRHRDEVFHPVWDKAPP